MSIKDKIFTVSEACQKFDITRQAVVLAIKNNRLKAVKIKGKWRFSDKDWKNYQSSKYHRRYSLRNGEYIYDFEKGILSPSMLAKEFGVTTQHIYYLIRQKTLPFKRIGTAYIVLRKDMINNKKRVKNIILKKNKEINH